MTTLGPFVPSHGPSPAPICLLAEAPGEEESKRGQPLVGPSGWALRQMLDTIGVRLDECRKINVFGRQPPGNNLAHLGTLTPSPEARAFGPLMSNPQLWIADAHLPDVRRALAEVCDCNPNVVIALGNTACWAMGLGTGINTLRGSVHSSMAGSLSPRPLKVLPTYHPSAVLRDWSLRTIALADLEKAHAESHSPDITYDNTELWLQPALADLALFDHLHMRHARLAATDVETKRGQITCVSFSPRPDIALVVPFWCEGQAPNYWPSQEAEASAWGWVRRWLERDDLTKVMQNGLYDIQYFRRHGISPRACTEDTMLAHHALYCELRKGLGFLGSIYANYPNWKSMRTFRMEEQLKRDE